MMILVENGRASLLLKSSSKRKRTKDELEEVKLEESALMEDRHSYLQQVKRLKQEHAEMMEALQAIEAQQQLQAEQAQPNFMQPE
jgi:predicted nuclease with TOPRIM domain